MDDEFLYAVNWKVVGKAAGIVLIIMLVCSLLGWVLDIALVQPMNRQTIDNNAARQIAVNQHFHQLLADIQTARTTLVSDENALAQFKQDHTGKLSYQDSEMLQELENNVTQDQVTLQADCNQYNTDMNNPDWRGADSSLPRSVTP